MILKLVGNTVIEIQLIAMQRTWVNGITTMTKEILILVVDSFESIIQVVRYFMGWTTLEQEYAKYETDAHKQLAII